LTTVFEATVRAVPREFRAKLEPAQIFHEVLDHRWYLAEAAGRDVPMAVAVASYVKNILPQRPDEKAVLGLTLAEMSAERTAEMTAELPQLTEEVMTRPLPEFDGDNTGAWGRSDSYDADEDDDDADDDTDDADADEPVLIVRTTTKRPPPKRTRPSASETTG
jgi:hypothetical protein